MAYLTTRCYTIATILLDRRGAVTIGELSRELQVSERTVRYDLDLLEDWMRERQVRLVRKSRVGVFVDRNSPAYASLGRHFQAGASQQQVYSRQERRDILALHILYSTKARTVEKLGKLANTSKSTAQRDLREVERYLASYGIFLARKTNCGVEAQGPELGKRKAVSDIVLGTHSLSQLLPVLKEGAVQPLPKSRTGTTALLEKASVPKVRECLFSIQKELGIHFTDEAAVALFVHIAVGMGRLREGFPVALQPEHRRILSQCGEYPVFHRLVTRMHGPNPCLDDEVGYVAMYALGAAINRGSLSETYMDMREAVREFALAAGEDLGVDLAADSELQEDLLTDLRPWITRERLQMGTGGCDHSLLRQELEDVYPAVSCQMKLLESRLDVSFQEDAVASFAQHVAAAKERAQQAQGHKYVTAVVVCGAGVGTAKLLSSRIGRRYRQIRVLAEYSAVEFRDFDTNSVDLVFTTIPTGHLDSNVIQVDPLLGQESCMRIDRFLEEHMTSYENRNRYLPKIIMIIENHCVIEDRKSLMEDLEEFLYLRRMPPPQETASRPLNTLLTKKTVACNVLASDYREAIRFGGALLLDQGLIRQQYIEDMVEAVNTYKSNIVIMPSVAMPHAQSNGNVLDVCMSLVQLEKPVSFGPGRFDNVRLVICLGAVDGDSHVQAMEDLLSILQNKHLLERILRAKTREEILLAVNNVY